MNIYNVIAHILSLVRIILTPAFAYLIYHVQARPEYAAWSKLILVTVWVSDGLDGYIARHYGCKSRLGAFLDPIADKIFLNTSLLLIALTYRLPLWIAVVLVGRDVGVLIVWSFYVFVSHRTYQAVPHFFGKVMIAFQVATIAAAVFFPHVLLVRALCLASIFFSLVSAVVYIVRIDTHRELVE